jgi:hypothetical protein
LAQQDRIACLRDEHRRLSGVADRVELSLALGSKENFSDPQSFLAELELEHGLRAIEQHCHAEQQALESTLRHFANEAARRRLATEHAEIARVLADFREELRCAKVVRTQNLRGPGLLLVGRLRSHIAYEETLLRNILKSQGGIKPRRAVARRKRVPQVLKLKTAKEKPGSFNVAGTETKRMNNVRHYHIRWSSSALDWEAYGSARLAEASAKNLVRHGESFTIEQFGSDCERCHQVSTRTSKRAR